MTLARVRTFAAVATAVGVAGTAASVFVDVSSIWPSYLMAFLFCWGLASGAVALLLLHQLVAGGWGFIIQRPLEAAAKTLPLVLLMFVPILLGMHDLYHWTHAEAVAADPLLQHKAPYLNTPFFLARAAGYFVVWMGLAFFLVRWSERPSKLQKIAGVGLVVWVVTTTFAAFDWAMSLDPHWFSTIYGLIFVVGQALGTLAFAIAVTYLLRKSAIETLLSTERIHDLGKLLFAFVMLWGYVNLSQFIIIWYGNLPEEIIWYVHRTEHGYEPLTLALVLLQFVLPFFILLSRHPKRRLGALAVIALFIVVVRLLDLFWLVMPGALRPHVGITVADVAAPLMLGGIWMLGFTFLLGRRPLLNRSDPRLGEVLRAP